LREIARRGYEDADTTDRKRQAMPMPTSRSLPELAKTLQICL
jgi:hypothetical protein